jgi:choloylglycine hydrolase
MDMRNVSVVALSSLALLVLGFAPAGANACTSFFIGGHDGRLMGFSYDWPVPGGRLIVNPIGLVKTALVKDGLNPASWTAKFGSVTFNQYGREFPNGGMNRAGLAMHVLWLDGSSYPTSEGPAIDALQWIQYCLDNFKTVGEVAESARTMAISSPASLHFFACDAAGSCAVIEFLNGAPVIRAGDELPLPLLTNSTYASSIAALDRSLGYGGAVAPGDQDASLERFVRAATRLNTIRRDDPAVPLERAFAMLAEVGTADDNQWRIVYDLRAKAIDFTLRGKPERVRLLLTALDFQCGEGAVKSLDLSGPLPADAGSALTPYRPEDNLELVRSSIARTEFLQPFPEERLLGMAAYPTGLSCAPPRQPAANGTPGPRPFPVD